ncbi:hypothetical protein [Szabonella alba]|uniref:Uncharacterized protein n=1 Tax=Szabonella alba TaxID=2804194 RepID=A0A8K0V7J7_9RHOB|nr:hypothetical protein [Szabonella alba]MBL4916927.1 hypothetical protein [Szabonella alba]
MGIDLIILGDSHSRALAEGARNLGLNIRDVTFSGALWHSGRFRYGKSGLVLGAVGTANAAMASLQKELGLSDILKAGIPVLTTMGFHLGRLVPPFGWHNHCAEAGDLHQYGQALHASAGFLHDYVDAFRAKHLKVLRQLSKSRTLIVVAPPVTFSRANYSVFRDHIKQRLIGAGVTLFDPMEDLAGGDGVLPADLIASDGTHANSLYGARVIEALQRRAMI